MTIAERILLLVEENGGNKSEFARRINVTPAYISKLSKNPDAEPSDRTIKDICREYRIKEEWLRHGIGDRNVPHSENEEIAEFLNDAMESVPEDIKRKLILALCKLSEEDWKDIDRLAKKLLNEN